MATFDDRVEVILEERELWEKFSAEINEMIITKAGRRLFPLLRLSVKGLNPSAMYSIMLEFVQVGEHRWKYVNQTWKEAGKADSSPEQTTCFHPESPNFGDHWMSNSVSFAKIKLFNKSASEKQIVLNSLHRYEPRIHIHRIDSYSSSTLVASVGFPEAQFIAVTAYQNGDITLLKIKYNPFAKAFRQRGDRSGWAGEDSLQAAHQYTHDSSCIYHHGYFVHPANTVPNRLLSPCPPNIQKPTTVNSLRGDLEYNYNVKESACNLIHSESCNFPFNRQSKYISTNSTILPISPLSPSSNASIPDTVQQYQWTIQTQHNSNEIDRDSICSPQNDTSQGEKEEAANTMKYLQAYIQPNFCDYRYPSYSNEQWNPLTPP